MQESEKAAKNSQREEWTVDCMTLPDFLATQGVDARNLVLKVDTEGAERDIIIGLKDWIAQYKPSMLLSMVRGVAAGLPVRCAAMRACRSGLLLLAACLSAAPTPPPPSRAHHPR